MESIPGCQYVYFVRNGEKGNNKRTSGNFGQVQDITPIARVTVDVWCLSERTLEYSGVIDVQNPENYEKNFERPLVSTNRAHASQIRTGSSVHMIKRPLCTTFVDITL